MEPPSVQYVKTSDGYDIAYSVSGQGQPFVYVPGQFSHLQNDWSEPVQHGPWSVGLSERFRLIRYDGRGQGLSSRGLREAQTIESLGRDLGAVVDHLQVDGFVLFARWYASHIAIRYVLANPGRVAALILMTAASKNSAWPKSVYLDLPQQNWNAFLLTQFPRAYDFKTAEQRIDLVNRAITPDDLATRAEAYAASTVEEALPQITVPTLVLHPRDYILLSSQESMNVAARIPDARFAFTDGEMVPGDWPSGMSAIEDFLHDLPEGAVPNDRPEVVAPVQLSVRETEVLQAIAHGLSNQQIADALVISIRTAERHMNHIYTKIGVHTKAQATAYALRQGLA